jgi:hypothetical protein
MARLTTGHFYVSTSPLLEAPVIASKAIQQYRPRNFEILLNAMNEKSHQKQGIHNTKVAKGTTMLARQTKRGW